MIFDKVTGKELSFGMCGKVCLTALRDAQLAMIRADPSRFMEIHTEDADDILPLILDPDNKEGRPKTRTQLRLEEMLKVEPDLHTAVGLAMTGWDKETDNAT